MGTAVASTHSIVGAFDAMRSSAIRVRQERCAKVRNRNVGCLKCAQACTSGCISVVDGELVIDASKCVGCGTCATVCPTCALETRNPSDSELIRVCEKARVGDEVFIICSQLCHACEDLLDDSKLAHVVCAGRVEESLAGALAAQGVKRIHVLCGDCAQCQQELGLSTARLVADTANTLFDAWGSDARVVVEEQIPSSVLAQGVSSEDVLVALDAYFAEKRACEPVAALGPEEEAETEGAYVHVMKDGTLPHFIPDRRENLLDSLSELGEPQTDDISVRLWGCVVIDGTKCSSCRMCATFCPTGAIAKFDEEDGTFGVEHYPGDCVKCLSCEDICPEGAITVLDRVRPSYLLDGDVHRYEMKKRAVELGGSHQIQETIKNMLGDDDIFER